MNEQNAVTIVMVEDDEGHARLTEKNIRQLGLFFMVMQVPEAA